MFIVKPSKTDWHGFMKQLQTELGKRVLRFDGVSIVNLEDVADALIRGVHPSKIRVRGTSQDIEAFNKQVAEDDRIYTEDVAAPINIKMGWLLPQKYLSLDLETYISNVFIERLPSLNYSDSEMVDAISRIDAELREIRQRGMVEFTKTIIFVLDTFRSEDLVWGVGRGSSCASYILFIIGLHVVDCIKYDVSMDEFFHD